jgi:hypothetical protein
MFELRCSKIELDCSESTGKPLVGTLKRHILNDDGPDETAEIAALNDLVPQLASLHSQLREASPKEVRINAG